MAGWTRSLTPFLSIFLESSCPLCSRSTAKAVCQDCQRQIQACQLANPGQSWQAPLPLLAWGAYNGTLKRAIAALKYDHQPQLAQPLGHWLAQAWLASPISAVKSLTVVPIPIHDAKRQQRGFNQAELLAQAFSDVTGLPMAAHGLVRVRATEAQFNLSAREREQNLEQAFQPGKEVLRRPARAILLLDDIYTTGATARAAMQALKHQHIQVYGIVTVARALQAP